MTKNTIEMATESGLGVSGLDVARVSRSGRCVTLRHVWPDGTDARVWAGVRRAAWRLAVSEATARGHAVEIYSAHGDMLDQVDSGAAGGD